MHRISSRRIYFYFSSFFLFFFFLSFLSRVYDDHDPNFLSGTTRSYITNDLTYRGGDGQSFGNNSRWSSQRLPFTSNGTDINFRKCNQSGQQNSPCKISPLNFPVDNSLPISMPRTNEFPVDFTNLNFHSFNRSTGLTLIHDNRISAGTSLHPSMESIRIPPRKGPTEQICAAINFN